MKRLSIKIQGLVQGVGFRPFVYRLAKENCLNGFVANSSRGVLLEIEGENCEIFIEKLQNSLPPLAKIEEIFIDEIPLKYDKDFIITKSNSDDKKSCMVLSDMAICHECSLELNDKNNRRYKYPFINCTNCGPRYSIINDIPYDRKFTSMRKFPMCKECEKEYTNPLNRRYHAEPISCKNCGPRLSIYGYLKDINSDEIIKKCVKSIKNGDIVAVKGIGGFHLICDAFNEQSLKKLRKIKSRPYKPFAVMCKDINEAKKIVFMNKYEESCLKSIEKPIIIMKKKNPLKDKLIAPLTDRLGVFLPNTPLHELLLAQLENPIIATSANLKGEPIITEAKEIDEKFCDNIKMILDNDRDILHLCDDSVLQMIDDKKLFMRISRGFAPLSIPFKKNSKNLLAVGAINKNAIAFYFDGKIVLSPYLGDTNEVKGYELFLQTIFSWKKFYNLNFDEILCDCHPNYITSKWAKEQNTNVSLVYHHHAHILATLFESSLPLNSEVLGVAFDGTGYGEDGSIWGGEFLLVRGRKFKRVVYFKPFKLLGGDKSIKNIDRIAYSMLLDLEIKLDEFDNLKFLSLMHKKNINSPLCSSVGRLFDAVCYFATGLKEITYDGESGLLLENLYDENINASYTLYEKNGLIHYDEMLKEILKDRKKISFDINDMEHAPKYSRSIATKFINALVNIIEEISSKFYVPVVLGGGVFQNKTLLEKLIKNNKIKKLYFPNRFTPNDGSICIGQLVYGLLAEDEK